ncbi:MAG: PAS-domain containing protein [Alphaproteobacteria bacterium]|nr:PAS-domain containing protein [Alphaproteobacteria bacterium]
MTDPTAQTPARLHGLLEQSAEAWGKGLVVVDSDLGIVLCNDRARELMKFPEGVGVVGQSFVSTLCFLALGADAATSEAREAIGNQLLPVIQQEPWSADRIETGGTVIEVGYTPLSGGGFVYTFEDVTEARLLVERNRRLARAHMVALANLAESLDTNAGDHVLRVARMAEEISRILFEQGEFPDILDGFFREQIGTASIAHDVGKIGVPDHVLLKPGPLDADERAIMNRHVDSGRAILEKASLLVDGALHIGLGIEIAETHHECFDGSGYPRKLAGDAIPLAGRIVAVCDVFDALSHRRPHKRPWPVRLAIAYIRERSGTQFDPKVVKAFEAVMEMRRRVILLRWEAPLRLGHPDIDEDRRGLVSLVNQLASAESLRDRSAVEMVLDEVLGHLHACFRSEEEAMRQGGYPDVERHAALHAELIDEVRRYRQRFVDCFGQPEEEGLAVYLCSWFQEHVREDGDFRHYLVIEDADPPKIASRSNGLS